jgi:Fe-S oxidoreductase
MTQFISIKKHIKEAKWEGIARDCYNQFACSHKMCRTYDPVVLATGDESYSAYGFHTSVLAVTRNLAKLEDLLDSFTYCLECASCEVRCPNTLFSGDFYRYTTTTIDLVRFVRRELYNKGLKPRNWEKVEASLNSLEAVGREELIEWSRDLKVKRDVPNETVFLVDTFTATQLSSIARDLVMILNKLGVGFTVVEPDSPLQQEYLSFSVEQFKKSAKALVDKAVKLGAKYVIVINPHLLTMLSREYIKYNEEKLPFEPIFFTDYLWELYKKGTLKFEKEVKLRAAYHDPCNLSKLNGIYDSPRNLLKAIPGITYIEEHKVLQWRYCCGFGNYIFKNINQDVSLKIGRTRVENAIDLGADALVVACPHCMDQFTEVTKTFNLNIQILHLSELILKAMG